MASVCMDIPRFYLLSPGGRALLVPAEHVINKTADIEAIVTLWLNAKIGHG